MGEEWKWIDAAECFARETMRFFSFSSYYFVRAIWIILNGGDIKLNAFVQWRENVDE